MKYPKNLLLTPILFAALFLHNAQATLVYEGFSGYTVDQTVVGQGPATTGFTGTWINTGGALAGTVNYFPRAANLSYTNYAPNSGGSLEAFRSSGSHSGDAKRVSRSFDYGSPGTADLFFSFLFENNSTSADADTLFRFRAGTNTNNDRDTRLTFNHDTGDVTITAGGGAATSYTETGIAGTNLMIIRAIYDTGINTAGNPNDQFYDRIQIWLNPTISASATPSVADLGTPDAEGFGIMRNFDGGGNPLAFNQFDFQHSLNSGNVTLDELVITSNLSDIVAIPEPGTLVLLGIALGSVLLFRRRK